VGARRKTELEETNAAPVTVEGKEPTRDVARTRGRQERALNKLAMAIVVVVVKSGGRVVGAFFKIGV